MMRDWLAGKLDDWEHSLLYGRTVRGVVRDWFRPPPPKKPGGGITLAQADRALMDHYHGTIRDHLQAHASYLREMREEEE